jgi:hypothetical protein
MRNAPVAMKGGGGKNYEPRNTQLFASSRLATRFQDMSIKDFDDNDPDNIEQHTPDLPVAHQISPWSPYTGDPARDKTTIRDEQVVNAALVDFLIALTIDHTDLEEMNWAADRHAFVVKNRRSGRLAKVYEARVDGVLCRGEYLKDDAEILVIMEVKPFCRSEKLDAIRMQETAQMAAWISQQPPSKPEPKPKSEPQPSLEASSGSRKQASLARGRVRWEAPV